MPLSNSSYILDLTELKYYTNYTIWKQLCTIDAEGIPPEDELTGLRLDRNWAALNFGRDVVDSVLGEIYMIPLTTTVTNNSPNALVKHWNVRLGHFFLRQLHIDRKSQDQDTLMDIIADMKPFIDPDGIPLVGHPRRNQPGVIIHGGKDKQGTIFDYADYWLRQIIPQEEKGNYAFGR